MTTCLIRKVTLQDGEKLQNIGQRTFVETFGASNTAENMARYLAESFSPDKLQAAITDPNSSCFFAESAGNLLGYLKVNTGQTPSEPQTEGSFEIERIYVLQAYQATGVGQTLFNHALSLARTLHSKYAWLGVWEKNQRAIAFYQRNGFVEFDRHIFRLGDEEQVDIMMRLELSPT